MKPCNHVSWIVGGGSGEWCYVCGAYRGLEAAYGKPLIPRTVWIAPTGSKNTNPAKKLKYKVRALKR